MTQPVLRLQDVAFRYGEGAFRLALPDLEIAAGERVACIGPSGSGKTTLVHLMAGILEPEEGLVSLEGAPLSSRSDRERRRLRITRIGMVFQRFALLDHLSVRDNALLPYHVTPHLRLDLSVGERLDALAGHMGIHDLLGRRPRQLSQGEGQRVALCRALITEPAVVLADEPTANLDPATAGRALDLVFERCEAAGAALVMVTHDHGILDRFDRVLEMGALAGGAAC